MVEIFPSNTSDIKLKIDTKRFYKLFGDPVVKEIKDIPCVKGADKTIENIKAKRYSVERYVVFLDNNIYKIIEDIHQDGYYILFQKKLIFKNSGKLGVIHIGKM